MADYLYNGAKLPDINTVWTDTTTYPYAYILYIEGSTLAPTLLLSSVRAIYNSRDKAHIEVPYGKVLEYKANDGVWEAGAPVSPGASDLILVGLHWTNTDVINEDNGSVYFAASIPVFVSKLKFSGVIAEWDGNTAGLTCAEVSLFGYYMKCYKVSDTVLTIDDFPNGALCVRADGSIVEIPTDEIMQSDGVFMLGSAAAFVSTAGATLDVFGELLVFPETGTYLVDADMPDGIYRTATLANPAKMYATDKEVTVNFTCTDLQSAEPVDSIHVWLYKKSDGLSTVIPPTWTSDMFAAPEYTVNHTFTGLAPNTEYEVYGCIFVNGEATDHNALAAFTTLEGDGDSEEEPVITKTSGDGYALYNGVKVLISEVPSGEENIPLNGMTVIEWNGGTAGLTVTDSSFLYKITDDVLASSQVIGGVFVQNVSSKLTAVRITTDSISTQENGIFIGGKIYSSGANTLAPEAGTYFPKIVSDYVQLFAYPNAADLKPVYRRESGKWVKKTAYEMQNGEWVLISTS